MATDCKTNQVLLNRFKLWQVREAAATLCGSEEGDDETDVAT